MKPTVRLGRTGLEVRRVGLGGFAFGCPNRARGWDPYTPEGREKAVRTIRAALDAGLNYIDTAEGYADGFSEAMIGEAIEGRRGEVVIATKVTHGGRPPEEIVRSVEESARRLRTDHVDIIQFHGGTYEDEEVDRILEGGQLEALQALRERGLVRFIGFSVEEPLTARPLIESGAFDMFQVRYNLIHQSAAFHALDWAQEADMGVAVMRPMTSGIFQRLASHLAPEWDRARDLYEVCLKFVLSDSRVHVANVGMRSPEEVEKNMALLESFEPPRDMADLPRSTDGICRTDDEMNLPS